MSPRTTRVARNGVAGYPIGSVGNALELLKLLKARPNVRVGEAAEALGVAQSTAHRLLSTLAQHGFLARDPKSRVYVVGPALLELGLSVIHGNTIRDLARPVIEALRDRLDATVSIAVLDGVHVLFIDAVLPDRLVQVGPRVGHRSHAHWNASGKAFLAELDRAELERRYPEEELAVATPSTIRTRTALFEEIERVRQAGYATVLGEVEVDAGAVGVVVRDAHGQAVAALAVTALVTSILPNLEAIVADAKRASAEITALLQ